MKKLSIIVAGLIIGTAACQAFAVTSLPTNIVTGHAPTVTVSIGGDEIFAGRKLTADSQFSDIDGDTEDTTDTGTSYQWQIADEGSSTFTDIPGATDSSYLIPSGYENENIRVAVTPATDVATTEPSKGVVTYSNSLVIVGRFGGISVGGYGFQLDKNFPTTGFANAVFKITVTDTPDNYSWESSQSSAVSVDSTGTVTLHSQPSGSVTISAIPHNGKGTSTYTFSIGKWFVAGEGFKTFADAGQACSAMGGVIPAGVDVNQSTPGDLGGVRDTSREVNGRVMNEWGMLDQYGWDISPTPDNYTYYWLSDTSNVDPALSDHVYLQSGAIYSNALRTTPVHYFCVKK